MMDFQHLANSKSTHTTNFVKAFVKATRTN